MFPSLVNVVAAHVVAAPLQRSCKLSAYTPGWRMKVTHAFGMRHSTNSRTIEASGMLAYMNAA